MQWYIPVEESTVGVWAIPCWQYSPQLWHLMAGASISKFLLVFKHMGLCAYSARMYFIHQKHFIFPVILKYWESCQAQLVRQLKVLKDVVWCGDGRFDSMGHSAKYNVYTMFCSSILKIVHFEVSIHIPYTL